MYTTKQQTALLLAATVHVQVYGKQDEVEAYIGLEDALLLRLDGLYAATCDTTSSRSLMLLHSWMMQDRRWYEERTSWPSHAVPAGAGKHITWT